MKSLIIFLGAAALMVAAGAVLQPLSAAQAVCTECATDHQGKKICQNNYNSGYDNCIASGSSCVEWTECSASIRFSE